MDLLEILKYILFVVSAASQTLSNPSSISIATSFNEQEQSIIRLSNSILESENEIFPQDPVVYNATWESLDSRPLPLWFDTSKIGIFINWGVHSVPSFGSEWFWNFWKSGNPTYVNFMKQNFPPNFAYADFAAQFTAEFYNPYQWADLFSRSGAKYIVFSSKHHEGYTLWPSRYSFSWNSMDVGPRRDLLGELAKAVRENTTLKFGVYHSLFEWYNPLYLNDYNNSFQTDQFVRFKTLPELFELVNTYKPEVIWSDGDWVAPDIYWKSREFLAWLYNDSPVKDTVVVNDRWGLGTMCKHGGYFSCQDRFNPGTLQPFKWENAMTLDKNTWGYRRNAKLSDYLTIEELVEQVAQTVACGGNILINIGPTKEGTIDPVMEERLIQIGKWLEVNGDAIYESNPWTKAQNDSTAPGVWYTRNQSRAQVYAIVLKSGNPRGLQIQLGSITAKEFKKVSILGYGGKIAWKSLGNKGVSLKIPDFENLESQWAFTIVFSQS